MSYVIVACHTVTVATMTFIIRKHFKFIPIIFLQYNSGKIKRENVAKNHECIVITVVAEDSSDFTRERVLKPEVNVIIIITS